MQSEIEESAFEDARKIEAREQVIVGVNEFALEGETAEIELHHLDPEIERRQVERTRRLRADRDAADAETALRRVSECARGEGNLLYPMRDALAARCTVGEICDALREVFGTYDSRSAP